MCPSGGFLDPKHFHRLLQINILDNWGLFSVNQMFSVTQSQRLTFTHGTPPWYPSWKSCWAKRAKPSRKWGRNVILSKSHLKPALRGLSSALLDFPVLGKSGTVMAQKCNCISSHIPPFSLTKITPKGKKSIREPLNSPPQHWPREAKRSQFSWHELKPVWQVYRACVNLTSE